MSFTRCISAETPPSRPSFTKDEHARGSRSSTLTTARTVSWARTPVWRESTGAGVVSQVAAHRARAQAQPTQRSSGQGGARVRGAGGGGDSARGGRAGVAPLGPTQEASAACTAGGPAPAHGRTSRWTRRPTVGSCRSAAPVPSSPSRCRPTGPGTRPRTHPGRTAWGHRPAHAGVPPQSRSAPQRKAGNYAQPCKEGAGATRGKASGRGTRGEWVGGA